MKINLKKTGNLALLIWLTSLSFAFGADPIVISSRFSPPVLSVGESGHFIVEVQDAKSVGDLKFPSIEGLRFNAANVHRSVRTQYVNGKRSSQMSYMVQIKPTREGVFTVPAFSIPVDGTQHMVPSASVEVTQAPPPPTRVAKGTPLVLQLDLAREKIYVGETLPARVKLYVASDLSASLAPPGMPMKEGDAFADASFQAEPQQRNVVLDNTNFSEVIWDTTLTPLKAGEQPLAFNLNLLVSRPPSDEELFYNQRMFNSPFGSLFGNMMPDYEEKFLTTGQDAIVVQELPQEGKPAHFNGAIGMFTVEQPTFSTLDAQVGDPITLTFKINGAGNFSRVDAPELVLPDYWKTYTPKSDYVAKDALGYRGEKTFEYILVPQAEGTYEIPALQFSFFNPEQGQYVKRSVELPPIKVRPVSQSGASYFTANTNKPSLQQPVEEEVSTEKDKPGLLPIQLELSAVNKSMTPVYETWFFKAVQLLLFLGLLVWIALRYKERRQNTSTPRLQAERAAQAAFNKAQAAADKGDAKAFYAQALEAIHHRLSLIPVDAPTAFTYAEVEANFSESHADALPDLKHFFEMADAYKFGGESKERVSLSDELRRLQGLMKRI